jgi:hypothetical protein
MGDSFVNKNKRNIGFILVLGLSGAAILIAVMQLVTYLNSLAIYNLIRALVFGGACIYIYRNPAAVNFMEQLKNINNVNENKFDTKISYFLAYLFSGINLAISLALYLD